jgi:uncharacterized membrane protein
MNIYDLGSIVLGLSIVVVGLLVVALLIGVTLLSFIMYNWMRSLRNHGRPAGRRSSLINPHYNGRKWDFGSENIVN